MDEVLRKRVNVLGLAIDPIEFTEAVDKIIFFAKSRPTQFVCVNSAQDVVIAQHDSRFRKIVNQANLATADGWPVVWNIRSQGLQLSDRVTGPDLMLAVCDKGRSHELKHFLYGGVEEVPSLLTGKLKQSFPDINICGAYSPPFRKLTAAEDQAEIDLINQSEADVLWIGISTPKQHFWVEDHLDKLNVGVVITVGAAFDFHSGRVKRAPKWMRENGLEWFHRAVKEPKRLGMRYLKYLPQFFIMSILQRCGLRQFSIKGCKTD
ncbi:WecB/TagA/CpsF family glycosyltransferase [Aliiglaciecola lipolytica]|uniref:UDP-N-acetyl-D-mannosaminuronic acid transferase n=1 Tax=Aliiglaciecola lipolytica E3 TaxID=1127673 RepID=K6YAL9_9ALTE|nr:WecB/TagA/CpsF family glycosyltransferase [Aliiglaciecola lipolytica]GAC13713.1 UDP-N-acetyl-D-mannosaminuronic acid transferase [Aliiglaciecola lipolytica E3]